MSLNNTTFSASLQSGETNAFGAVTASANFTHQSASITTPLTNGTGSGQANHALEVTGAAGTGGVSIDLTAVTGGLDGKVRDFSNGGTGGAIKDLIIENLDPANTITITQPGANGWTGFSGAATGLDYPIEPGGCLALHSPVAGRPVGAANKLFTLTGSAGSPQYKMSIAGIGA